MRFSFAKYFSLTAVYVGFSFGAGPETNRASQTFPPDVWHPEYQFA
jgi:hypothetical protein